MVLCLRRLYSTDTFRPRSPNVFKHDVCTFSVTRIG